VRVCATRLLWPSHGHNAWILPITPVCYDAGVHRRTFLETVGAGLAAGLTTPALAAQSPVTGWKVGGFTKPIQDLSFDQTAQFTVDAGWDGIELALRAGGHVLPERADEDLPKMVAALKAKNRDVLALATDIKGGIEPLTERVLRAAAKAGIRFYRLGALRYRNDVSITMSRSLSRSRTSALSFATWPR
jgi:hypothetical protein